MDYEIVKLKEIADFNKESIGKNSNYEFINYLDTANITNGAIDTIVRMPIEEAPSRAKRIVHNNDIVYSTVRPNLCHYGILDSPVENMIVSTGFTVISCKDDVNPYYIYNYLTQNDITSQLHSIAENSTSAYPSIKPSDLESIEIKLPKLDIQNKIAKILTDINKKIKINNEINNNLLEQIKSIYNEVFTQFDDYKRLDEISNVTIGKTPPRSEQECFTTDKNDVKWISISDLGKSGMFIFDTSEKLTREAVEKYNVRVIPKDTVILSFKLTVGRTGFTTEDMTTNEAIAHFDLSDKKLNNYLYCYLTYFNYSDLGSTSSIATAINSKIVKSIKIGIPSKEQLDKFNKLTSSMFDLVKNNEEENIKLSDLRDTLLPKLMNGEIDLNNMRI